MPRPLVVAPPAPVLRLGPRLKQTTKGNTFNITLSITFKFLQDLKSRDTAKPLRVLERSIFSDRQVRLGSPWLASPCQPSSDLTPSFCHPASDVPAQLTQTCRACCQRRWLWLAAMRHGQAAWLCSLDRDESDCSPALRRSPPPMLPQVFVRAMHASGTMEDFEVSVYNQM